MLSNSNTINSINFINYSILWNFLSDTCFAAWPYSSIVYKFAENDTIIVFSSAFDHLYAVTFVKALELFAC